MSTYPNLKSDLELLQIKTKVDENKNLTYKTEKTDHEKISKSHKIDIEFFKKDESLNKKKVLLIITETFLQTGSAEIISTMSLINPSTGTVITSSAVPTSIAILISNEYISKSKLRYTKLREWLNVTTLL